jgi:Na+-translocating ferredoxin:NAD+ oxidoreductase RnfD subunit
MKAIIVFFIYSLLFLQYSKSQDSLKINETQSYHKVNARISFSETQSMRVPIMAMTDSSIFVYEKSSVHKDPLHKTNIYIQSNWDSYNYRFISSVKVQNRKLRAWLIPTSIVAGLIGGAIIGKNSGNNKGDINSQLNNAGAVVLGAFLGGAVGTIAGFAISSAVEKKYLINGDWKSFEEMKADLKY